MRPEELAEKNGIPLAKIRWRYTINGTNRIVSTEEVGRIFRTKTLLKVLARKKHYVLRGPAGFERPARQLLELVE